MKPSSCTSSRDWLDISLRSLAVFLLYGGVILVSSLFTFEPSSTPLFWPANAIVLCIMLYAINRLRAVIYLGSAFLSYYIYLYFYDSFGFGPSFLLTCANILEIAAGYFLIRRFVSWPLQFGRLKNTIELIVFGVILNSIFGAAEGTILMHSVWESSTFISWAIWFGTAAIGNLMVLALIVSWRTPQNKTYTKREITEMAVLLFLCFASSLLIFSADKDQPTIYPYMAFPMLLWSGMRFDLRITSIAFQIFLVVSAIASSQGSGPFAMGDYYRDIVLLRFHLFCGVTMITVLLVSALRNEREVLISDLRDAFGRIKTLSGFIPICAHCKKIRDDSGYWNHLETYIRQHSDAELSHGICPSCAEEHFGEFYSSTEDSGPSSPSSGKPDN